MRTTSKPIAAILLTIMMFTGFTSAGLSNWNGNSALSGTNDSVTDAFQVPGNATVIDAWLHVDESGYLEDGSGLTWNNDNTAANFSAGMMSNTTSDKFSGALSLSPDSAVSNIESFASAVLQFSNSWTTTGNIWAPANPSTLNGTISGSTQTLAHGSVPATAASGGVVAATLAGQALQSGSSGSLITPTVTLPNPINLFNLSFAHWHHLDSLDGAWVEYKLDTGNWTYMEPNGGYPHTISNNASVPTGANSSGFGVFGDGNHSGWTNAVFNLDNLTGIQNATTIQFRFNVWTDTNNTARPGWFIDDIELLNVGNSVGYWHHGCYVNAGTCAYSNNANGAMESEVNLSGTTTGAKIQTKIEWDLEGSTYDNFCIEMSTNNGTSWTDISSSGSGGSTLTSCRSRTGAIPGSGFTLPNGTQVGDQSGGFVTLEFAIPTSMIGTNNTTKIRYVVETDGSVQYGSPQDNYEGLTVDWFKVIDANGTALSTYNLDNSSSATHYGINGATDDWSFLQIGQGGLSITDGFEDSPALPPGAWTVQNVAGQIGWEFGALCSNFTSGPSSYPSANLGFATTQCGNYDGSSDNSLITPEYYIPLGASARFVWKHWMCAEDGWDGGALYVSVNNGTWNQAYVNYANNTTWYDGQITNGPFVNTDVWDGRQYVTQSGGFSCSTATIPWVNMSYDVSNLSGNNVSFKFRMMSDSFFEEPGWYVDDIGLEVDYFLTEGNWMSPLISPHDLGYGFADADIYLPNGTWYGVNVHDSSGQVIPGHENLSFPISLASIDRDSHSSGIYLELMLGSSDEYFTPVVKALSVGATRYLGDSNGWSIPSSITRLSNGSWQNNIATTQMIAGDSGYSSRPISSAMVNGMFTQTTVSLLTSGTQTVSVNTVNSSLNLGGMKHHLSPQISMAPNAIIESLSIQGYFAQPAHEGSIDLANDGNIDWKFDADPAYGSYGWQTRINDVTTIREFSSIGNDSFSVIIPEDAALTSLLIGITPIDQISPLTISSGSTTLYQFTTNDWTSTTFMVANPNLQTSSNQSDNTGRIWNVYDFDVTTDSATEYNIGSISIGYSILENVSGLGQVVKDYHELNSNNGEVSIVDIPLTWAATAGGVGIDGGVYHENMITNHPFTVPQTWYPNGISQSFTTQHHHLYGNENIAEIHLIGTDSNGESIEIVLSDISNGGTFTQNDGSSLLNLHSNSSVSEINGRLVVDWIFDVSWNYDDVQSITWSAQGYDSNGEGLSPATAISGGTGTQAVENDLMVDSWNVVDLFGHTLSDMFSPSYPFYAKEGSLVSVSGTVKFENTADMRPLIDDFVVAIDIDGDAIAVNSTGDGQWTGLVQLPEGETLANLTPYIVRLGPIQGAVGVQDVTLTTPVVIKLDGESPYVSNLQVNTGQKLVHADGYTWDPSTTLSLQVTITDDQALGSELIMHTWREVMDDSDGDGEADMSEYQTITKTLPEGVSGERTLTYSGIDVSGLDTNAKFSVFFTGTDYAGLPLMYGGTAGLDNDMATLIIAVNEPTNIPQSELSFDTHNEQLLAGQMHTLTMQISDLNGISSIDIITVNLLGPDEETRGVMTWEPRNGQIYSPNGSQITLHEVVETLDDGFSVVEWKFSLDWDFDSSSMGEYGTPSIVVFDDDDLNPVTVLTNIGELYWQLDNDLEISIENIVDNTPPISSSSPNHVYVQPGDDLTVSGTVHYSKSGVQLELLPEDGLEVLIETYYGNELLSYYTNVEENGTWNTGMILPSRSLNDGELTVSYSIIGVVSPGSDASMVQSMITVDDVRPIVQFSEVPLSLDNEELELLQFALQIIDSGGMPAGDLTVNWAFMRNSLIMADGQSSAMIPFVSENADIWTYAGTIDFTDGVNVTLEDGDELIWWIDVVDRAGNIGKGTGLSMIDAMNTDFVILSVDITVTNIEITLADGSLPKANQIVEGEELGIKVQLRNLGTKEGIISVTLYEDLGPERTWLAHEKQEITIYPGQTTETQIMPFETYKDGAQNIYINISGMDLWLDNTQLPHCVGNDNTATCDLGVETDMPRVVSQDSAESGTTGLIFTISILVILLGAAGVAITVLIRRQNQDQDSIFYEDDDSNQWVDDTYGDQKVTPVLPEGAASQPLATGNEIITSDSQTKQTPASEENAQSDSTVQSTEHPGWIWDQESNEWVADPNYRPPNV